MAACGGKKDCKDEKEQENYDDAMAPADRMNAIKDIFIKADKSGDKLLDLNEWLACSKEKDGDKYDEKAAKAQFAKIDQSNSNSISLAELDLFIANTQLEQVS